MKLIVTETSGATFTSSKPYEMELSDYLDRLSEEQVAALQRGESVSLVQYNRVGTASKRTLKPVK